MSRVVHVAVGVILGNDGAILIAKRPDNVHQGGLWEFPGGKLEQGESVFDALKRELQEELSIKVVATEPLLKIRHDYGDKTVLLDVHKVTEFEGQPQGNEGQAIQWVAASALHGYEFPAANRPIITAINLPQRLLITGAFTDNNDFVARTERALQKGIRFVQLRLQNTADISSILAPFVILCNSYSAQVSVNTSPEGFAALAGIAGCGLHLNSAQLMNCTLRPVGRSVLLSASCHTEDELKHAEKIGVDFVCISPVLATSSHPDQMGIGWDTFTALVDAATIPVYALGGMTEANLTVAVACGAQGIAAISEWWA